MATIDLGKIAFTQKGTYDASTSYAPRDIVQHTDDGEVSSYVKVGSTATGQTPSTNGTINTTHWALFAKGATIASNYKSASWSNSTAYQKGDVVQFTDSGTLSTYLAVADSTGQQPSTAGTINSSFWAFLAKGTASVAISWQSVKTANFNASASEAYPVNTTSGSITATLPASPSVGDRIVFRDYNRTWDSNALVLALNGNNFQGNSSVNPSFLDKGGTADIVYIDATKGWLPVYSVANEAKTETKARFLVVAGGGSTGTDNGGGGGAGGFRGGTDDSDGKFDLTASTTYTCTIGAGGGGSNNSFTDAGNSSISGAGLTTITATRGGFGNTANNNGQSGGSGGGGGQNASGGSGNQGGFTPVEGHAGGTSSGTSAGGAGGGGAGAVGQNCSGSSGVGSVGDGGIGKSTDITGTETFFAGGGGGGSNQANEAISGAGGSGGGGDGGHSSSVGQSGTANTGGGGGGCSQNYSGGTHGLGGSGVVILRLPTSLIASTTGSPTITTIGGQSVVKFTGTGTLVTTAF